MVLSNCVVLSIWHYYKFDNYTVISNHYDVIHIENDLLVATELAEISSVYG